MQTLDRPTTHTHTHAYTRAHTHAQSSSSEHRAYLCELLQKVAGLLLHGGTRGGINNYEEEGLYIQYPTVRWYTLLNLITEL